MSLLSAWDTLISYDSVSKPCVNKVRNKRRLEEKLQALFSDLRLEHVEPAGGGFNIRMKGQELLTMFVDAVVVDGKSKIDVSQLFMYII